MEKTDVTETYEGPLYCDVKGDFFQSIEEILEHYAEWAPADRPTRVYACEVAPLDIPIVSMVQDYIQDNHYEGAEEDISDAKYEALSLIVEMWCEGTGIESYDKDPNKYVVMDWSQIDA